mmetsp:Transcript_6976/g.17282  ORF Transcript_6976/g.17282 Transcript_6976/m.17282 type:complete len:422 (-) Transcript_6976:192-1457(-)
MPRLDELEDSFDEADAGQHPLYGRVKSLKSIDFDSGRQRTFASQQTDTTRKATNRGNRQEGPGKDDSATFESSLNNSSIASDIFDDHPPHYYPSGRGGTNDQSSPPKHQSETRSGKRMADNRLPQLPATPPRPISRNGKNDIGRRHGAKRAENLGDSSVEENDNPEIAEEDQNSEEGWSDDDVSELSGIGNDSIEGREKRRKRKQEKEERRRRRHRGRGGGGKGGHGRSNHRYSKSQEKSSSRRNNEGAHQGKSPQSKDLEDWTQQELDSFISQNDWNSVSKYINEMRAGKEGRGKDGRDQESDQIATRNQPSIDEIQKRIEYNRRMESESSGPKIRFGARSQKQHDEASVEDDDDSRGSRSRSGVESESVWQSLSSASYESEDSSSHVHSQQRRSRCGGRRRSLSDNMIRRRNSPREKLL